MPFMIFDFKSHSLDEWEPVSLFGEDNEELLQIVASFLSPTTLVRNMKVL